MKKAITSLLLSAMMAASAQPFESFAATNSVDTLITKVEPVTSNIQVECEDGQFRTVYAGAWKVTLKMENNPGYANAGLRIPYNRNLVEPYKYTYIYNGKSYKQIYYTLGPACDRLLTNVACFRNPFGLQISPIV